MKNIADSNLSFLVNDGRAAYLADVGLYRSLRAYLSAAEFDRLDLGLLGSVLNDTALEGVADRGLSLICSGYTGGSTLATD